MKKIGLIFTSLLVILLVSCKNKKDVEIKNENETNNVLYSYVGSYTKNTSGMGVVNGSQLLNFYNDGKLIIYCAFYNSGPGGAASAIYEGSYEIVDENLSINYSYYSLTSPDTLIEKDVEAKIENDTFRAQIFLCANMPDDGTSSINGLSFYKIEPIEIKNNLTISYIGSVRNENEYYAFSLIGNKEEFQINYNFNKEYGVIKGKYEVIIPDNVDEDNQIKLIYNDKEYLFNYNNSKCFIINVELNNNMSLNCLMTYFDVLK